MMGKRGMNIILSCFLVFNSLIMSAQEGSTEIRRPRIQYGVEWGWIGNFLALSHEGYYATEGYIVDDEYSDFFLHSNGKLEAFIGCNLGSWNISVKASTQGLYDDLRACLGSLCLSYFFSGKTFVFLGYGLGKERSSPHEQVSLGYIGMGRRYALTRSMAVDMKLNFQTAFVHPDIYDDGVKVSAIRTRKNDAYVMGVALAIALVF